MACGSMMTLSPLFVVVIVGRLTGFWSQSRGAKQGLMKPAANASMTRKRTKSGKDAGVGIIAGAAGLEVISFSLVVVFRLLHDDRAHIIKRKWATTPTAVPTQMVLNLPHLVSAMIPPKMGIT